MAKKQTRRSISLNREHYAIVKRAAEQHGLSIAKFVVDALRRAGVDLPPTAHMAFTDAQHATKQRRRQKALPAPSSGSGPIRRALGDAVADRVGEP
jgi:uncharacterized protein (DUF1778 family)